MVDLGPVAPVDPDTQKPVELCRVCLKEIKTMCFKGTGVCSELCNKFTKGETD